MNRWMYRAQIKEKSKAEFLRALEADRSRWERELRQQGLLTGSLFDKGHNLLLYFESAGERFEWAWPAACGELLERWPGDGGRSRLAVAMLDIFHDGEPEPPGTPWPSDEGRVARERIGSLARLKPDMYGSYVFYHYALQEETPESFNPTYMIGAHETLIFSYHEMPEPPFGNGTTRRTWPAPITPKNWYETMLPHFVPWSDGEQGPVLWEKMNLLLAF